MEVNRVLTKKNTVLTKFNTVLTKKNSTDKSEQSTTKVNTLLTNGRHNTDEDNQCNNKAKLQ